MINNTIPVIHDENDRISFFHFTTDDCEIEVHFHDSCEIVQACSSNIRYFVEGKAYDLKKGDILITNTKEIHRPSVIDNGPYDRRFIQFKPSIFTAFFDTGYNPMKIFEDRPLGIGNVISLSEYSINNKITKIFDQIEDINAQLNPKNYVYFKSLLIQLFIELDDFYHRYNPDIDYAITCDSRIAPVLDLLNNNYEKPFSLDSISQHFYMDKYYLSHLFKKNTGFTIYEYIQSKRIQKAKELIHEGIPITEASHIVGFIDYSNFYKAFRKLMQISPTAYKKLIESPNI